MPEGKPKDLMEQLYNEGRSYVAGESKRLKAKYGDKAQQVVRGTAKQYKQGMKNAWQNSTQTQRLEGQARAYKEAIRRAKNKGK